MLGLFFTLPREATGQDRPTPPNFQDVSEWELISEQDYTITFTVSPVEQLIVKIGKTWKYKNMADETLEGWEIAGINNLQEIIQKVWGKQGDAAGYQYALLVRNHWIIGNQVHTNVNLVNMRMQHVELKLTFAPPDIRAFVISFPNPFFKTPTTPLQPQQKEPQRPWELPGRPLIPPKT
jgi:hypothetical protein